eukprot:EG_transcript_24038
MAEELGLNAENSSMLEYLFTAVHSDFGETKHGRYQDNEYQDVYLLLWPGMDPASLRCNAEVCEVRAVPWQALRAALMAADPVYVQRPPHYVAALFRRIAISDNSTA